MSRGKGQGSWVKTDKGVSRSELHPGYVCQQLRETEPRGAVPAFTGLHRPAGASTRATPPIHQGFGCELLVNDCKEMSVF
jgi:hypothetical protein